MPPIQIDYLGHHPDAIPLIAQWHQDEWHHISPEQTIQSRVALYQRYKNQPAIPCCLLALINGRVVGSASLVNSDMASHPHLGPWLASVYVKKDCRQQGIASRLIDECLNNARTIGLETLYLFTPSASQFYLNRGWQMLEMTLYQGEEVSVMSYNLLAGDIR